MKKILIIMAIILSSAFFIVGCSGGGGSGGGVSSNTDINTTTIKFLDKTQNLNCTYVSSGLYNAQSLSSLTSVPQSDVGVTVNISGQVNGTALSTQPLEVDIFPTGSATPIFSQTYSVSGTTFAITANVPAQGANGQINVRTRMYTVGAGTIDYHVTATQKY